jgi:WhiB family transcriptional regulator, redox-sensing transcriptional regulator
MTDVRRLPAPNHADWEWQQQAACRGQNTESFYHPERERGPSRLRRERAAKEVCARCPVIENCLRWALHTREPYGIWGGLSVEERDLMLTKRSA